MNKKLQEYKKSNIRQKSNTNDSYDIIKELLSGLNANLKEALIYMEKKDIDSAKEHKRAGQSFARHHHSIKSAPNNQV